MKAQLKATRPGHFALHIAKTESAQLVAWFIHNRWSTWFLNEGEETDTHFILKFQDSDKPLVLQLVEHLREPNKHTKTRAND